MHRGMARGRVRGLSRVLLSTEHENRPAALRAHERRCRPLPPRILHAAMKARGAIFRAPTEPLEVVELDLEEPRAGEVLVRMAAVGVCGSDLHVLKGEWPRPVPMVLGHEGTGTVEALGEDVTGLAVGDRVVISW